MGTSNSIPGVLLTAFIAVVAFFIHGLPFAPFTIDGRHPIDALLIAIILGMLARNTIQLPSKTNPGIKYSVKKILPFAIVLMGAKLNFVYVLEVSAQALWISVLCVFVALALTIWLCQAMGVSQKLGILIGIGTAICGGTAIAVAAPTIEADDNDTAFAITTITIFGLIAIFAFPVLGHTLTMSQEEFGIWAGIAIQATPQVMAAGFAYGDQAGEIAVIVKLVRVLLLAPLMVILGAWYSRAKQQSTEEQAAQKTKWSTFFPPFILGFIALAIANSLNLIPDVTLPIPPNIFGATRDQPLPLSKAITKGSLFLVTMAMAGVGLGVHIQTLRKVGMKALYVGCFAALVLSGFSYGLLALFL
ncbi:MAG: YeiH family protein [Myxococcota bacterium]|nr:YeiH family protein [Myxococcota bacterium]